MIAELVNHRVIVKGTHADSMALGTFQKHPGQPEQWVSDMALLDLLDDLRKSAFLREKVDLNRRWFDVGTGGLFFPALKTWPISPWRPRATPFAAALGRGLDRPVIRGGLSIRLFPPTAVVWSARTPRPFVATIPPSSLVTVL